MGAGASSANPNPVQTLPLANVMAAPWMPVSPQVAGVLDLEWDVNIGPLDLAAATTIFGNPDNGQQLQLDADYDYLVREIQIVIQNVDDSLLFLPSDLRVRIRDSNGRLFTSDFCYALDLNGPLALPWPLKRGGVLTFDLANANATDNIQNLYVVLKGWKRSLCPGQPAVDTGYIPMRRRITTDPHVLHNAEIEDYEYPFTFTAAAISQLLKQPLQTDNDADFLWRGLCGDWNNPANDVPTVGNVVLAFYDPNGTPLGSFPFNFASFPQPVRGMLRECILANGGGGPNPMFPEVFVPRGGVPQLDIYFGGSETVRLSLRGQKIYRSKTGL